MAYGYFLLLKIKYCLIGAIVLELNQEIFFYYFTTTLFKKEQIEPSK